MSYICSLPFQVGYDLILECIKRTKDTKYDQQLWDIWLVKYSKMTQKTFQSWADFYKETKHFSKISTRKTEEIYKDSIEIYKRAMAMKK